MASDNADSEGAGTCVCADAHRKGQVEQIQIREIPLHFFFIQLQFFRIHKSVGYPDLQRTFLLQVRKAG